MEKSLVLEMEDNHNGLTYLIDGNKEQEKLLSLINTNHQKLSIFYKKQNFKEKIDSIINSKINLSKFSLSKKFSLIISPIKKCKRSSDGKFIILGSYTFNKEILVIIIIFHPS